MVSATDQIDATEVLHVRHRGQGFRQLVGIVKLEERLVSMLLLDRPLRQGPF